MVKTKKVKLADLVASGYITPDGTIKQQADLQSSTTADLSDQNVSYGDAAAQSVASAASITLPDAPLVTITGTERISTIAAKKEGTLVRLLFSSPNCIVQDHNVVSGGNIHLMQGHYLSVINGILCLIYSGGQWVEDHRSNPSILDLWFRCTSAQSITYNTLTNVQFQTSGYFGYFYDSMNLLCDDPADSSLNSTTPKTTMCVRLPLPGLYTVDAAVTFKGNNCGVTDDADNYLKAHLMEYYAGGAPDGSTTDPWSAIGDLNQVVPVRSSSFETTLVGTHSIYSDGSNYVKVVCQERLKDGAGVGQNTTLSGSAYETFLRVIYRGY